MNFKRNKFVRFNDWSSPERSSSSERRFSTEDGLHPRQIRELTIPRAFESDSERILDPGGQFLLKWNKYLFVSCVIAVLLDTLFLYIPVFNGKKKCLGVDKTLAITVCVLRSFTDIFYILHIVFQFRAGFFAPSQKFGRFELMEDQVARVKTYSSLRFIIDILSVLPLPQAVLIIIPRVKGPVALVTKDPLKYIILFQYVPRFIRIYPLFKVAAKTSGLLTKTAWAGAAFYLVLYMLASHVVGAIWYMLSIERKESCWRHACRELKCDYKNLYCGEHHIGDNAFLDASCPLIPPDGNQNSKFFDFGIFLVALQSGVVESRDFPQKLSYCFWWGLRNLSSLGQNLQTSTFVGEIFFAVFISVFGLVLFSLLIGNMQKYLLSTTVSVDRGIEEMKAKRAVERWMSHYMLPEDLREQILRHKQNRWQETRGVEEETLNPNLPIDLFSDKHLPKDLRRDIKRHLCFPLLRNVPMFEKIDEQLLDVICEHLKPVFYIEKSVIAREGDPVDEMLFITRGVLLSLTSDGGRTCNFREHLKANDFWGGELLMWAMDPNSFNLPTSTQLVRALTEVEGFAIMADDLKIMTSQWTDRSRQQLLHIFSTYHPFRFYSPQWRTWAACFIQAAWHHFCKRKLEKALREEEDRLQEALGKEAGTSSSLGATIYASNFAVKLRTLPRNSAHNARLQQRLLPTLPQKPAQPDFTAEDHY